LSGFSKKFSGLIIGLDQFLHFPAQLGISAAGRIEIGWPLGRRQEQRAIENGDFAFRAGAHPISTSEFMAYPNMRKKQRLRTKHLFDLNGDYVAHHAQ